MRQITAILFKKFSVTGSIHAITFYRQRSCIDWE